MSIFFSLLSQVTFVVLPNGVFKVGKVNVHLFFYRFLLDTSCVWVLHEVPRWGPYRSLIRVGGVEGVSGDTDRLTLRCTWQASLQCSWHPSLHIHGKHLSMLLCDLFMPKSKGWSSALVFLEILSFVGLHGVTLSGFSFNILGFLFPILFLKLSLYMFFNYLYLS